MTTPNEVKPCPFCEGEVQIRREYRDNPNPGYGGETRVYFDCQCGAKGPGFGLKTMASFTDYTVKDFRENPILRAREEDRYAAYCADIDVQALTAWNNRAAIALPVEPTAQRVKFEARCRSSEECLPDAQYRNFLTALHDEMLDALIALPTAKVEPTAQPDEWIKKAIALCQHWANCACVVPTIEEYRAAKTAAIKHLQTAHVAPPPVDAQDARRYRWLRSLGEAPSSPDEMDAEIDEAIVGGKP